MEPSITTSPFITQRQRKILIVDDDRLNIRILGGILRTEGYLLAEADSGESACDAYARFLPDLVLLDVMMPGIDGFETCRELKRRYGDKCAPIIFITAKNDSEDVVAGLAAGCTAAGLASRSAVFFGAGICVGSGTD